MKEIHVNTCHNTCPASWVTVSRFNNCYYKRWIIRYFWDTLYIVHFLHSLLHLQRVLYSVISACRGRILCFLSKRPSENLHAPKKPSCVSISPLFTTSLSGVSGQPLSNVIFYPTLNEYRHFALIPSHFILATMYLLLLKFSLESSKLRNYIIRISSKFWLTFSSQNYLASTTWDLYLCEHNIPIKWPLKIF